MEEQLDLTSGAFLIVFAQITSIIGYSLYSEKKNFSSLDSFSQNIYHSSIKSLRIGSDSPLWIQFENQIFKLDGSHNKLN